MVVTLKIILYAKSAEKSRWGLTHFVILILYSIHQHTRYCRNDNQQDWWQFFLDEVLIAKHWSNQKCSNDDTGDFLQPLEFQLSCTFDTCRSLTTSARKVTPSTRENTQVFTSLRYSPERVYVLDISILLDLISLSVSPVAVRNNQLTSHFRKNRTHDTSFLSEHLTRHARPTVQECQKPTIHPLDIYRGTDVIIQMNTNIVA